ncbi:MAG: HAMP domain-containing histidine kinase [Muribaculaceae bacterium]|nr:HAMP domain-containing histidine kinase [Muribaculaceae bacterium]
MSTFRHFVLLVLLGFSAVAWANRAQLSDSLNKELAAAIEPSDSLRILYDIFDSATRTELGDIMEEMWAVAQPMNDVKAQMEIIRHTANRADYDEVLYQRNLDRVAELPDSPDKVRTSLYVKIMYKSKIARSASDSMARRRMAELITQIEDNGDDTTVKQIELLFTLCAYLEQFSSSPLMSQYLDKLEVYIRRFEREFGIQPYMLTYQYLTQRALAYSSIGNHAKAVEADKKLLNHIDYLVKQYKAAGRMQRDLHYNRYVCYRRMLCNYKALSDDEIEEYYGKLKELAHDDVVLSHDFYNVRMADACYYTAKKRYQEALPILRRLLESPSHDTKPYITRQVVEMTIEAARETGNKDLLLEALLISRDMTEKEQEILKDNQLSVMQLMSDVNETKLQQQMQHNERLEHKVDMARTVRNYSIVLAVVMVIFLFVIFIMWRRAKMLNKGISHSNGKLTEERDILKHTQNELIKANDRIKRAEKKREDFVNNMSHEIATPLNAITEYSQLLTDCADEEKRPYLKRFSDAINLNADLILRLVNDVLEVASSDKNMLKIDCKPGDVASIAEIAGDTFKHRLNPGVTFVNNVTSDKSMMVTTDSKRVMQVLLNLLVNAAKFTEEGSITLDGKVSGDGLMYEYSVTDTGIGIPAGKEEIIFKRFEQLNSRTQGIGLGLAVCRLVASALGGEVFVDTSHTGRGARFVFRFPVKSNSTQD